jgi:hypothetical protein
MIHNAFGVLGQVRHLVTLLPVGSAAPDHTVYPTGTVPLTHVPQALRGWLRSACPSGTKAIRPTKRLALS